MPRVHARLCGDIDQSESGVVILCCVRIETETNFANLRFGRQLSAAKSVDTDLRAGTGKLIDCVFKLVWIVR